jgi:hypothetical protein
MTFDRIDRLVTKEDFYFQAWRDSYGVGVWVALGRGENQIDTVRDLSSNNRAANKISAMDYVFSAEWLPIVTGGTLADAMQKLEERLAGLPQDQLSRESQWSDLVSQALMALIEAANSKDEYPDSLDDLPATFELAVERLAVASDTDPYEVLCFDMAKKILSNDKRQYSLGP